ncbi:MAG: hypothetical protein ACLRMZ_00075 [Blautia marasmi]
MGENMDENTNMKTANIRLRNHLERDFILRKLKGLASGAAAEAGNFGTNGE